MAEGSTRAGLVLGLVALAVVIGVTVILQRPATVSGNPISGIASVSAGGSHTCSLSTTGAVQCWGSNDAGQLGNGSTIDSATPVGVVGLGSGVATLDAHSLAACVAKTGGEVSCWGGFESSTPTAVPGVSAVAVAVGFRHACAITPAGGAMCWGPNDLGELGNGSFAGSSTPVSVVGLTSGVVELTAGEHHSCALLVDGSVRCWGRNSFGELGSFTGDCAPPSTDPVECSSVPVGVEGLSDDIVTIGAGAGHTCAVTAAGAVKCWGLNDFGQLGSAVAGTCDADNIHTCSTTALDVQSLSSGIVAVVGGTLHTCALTSVGGVKCWGENAFGRLGDGTTTDSVAPVDVQGLGSGVAAVTAGGDHSCALTMAEALLCWGANVAGQLGDGTTQTRLTPTSVVAAPKPTPTPTTCPPQGCPTASPGPVMALSVPNGGVCEGEKCEVLIDSKFTLAVDVVVAPPENYVGIQTKVDYGLLQYLPADDAADEILWPDAVFEIRGPLSPLRPTVTHGSLTGLVSPYPESAFVGAILQLSMRCGSIPQSSLVRLEPFDVNNTSASGFGLPPGSGGPIPMSDSLTINCVAQLPATATPTPAPPSTPLPVGGVGAYSDVYAAGGGGPAVGWAAVLGATAALVITAAALVVRRVRFARDA